jgi:hypothetical protein
MPYADRGEPLAEIILVTLFHSQCLQIAKKAYRQLVVIRARDEIDRNASSAASSRGRSIA